MQALRLTMVAILFGASYASAAGEQAPRIEGRGKAAKLVMPDAVRRAVEKAAPGFRPWRFKDYLPSIQEGFEQPDSMDLPFAVVTDINKDGASDLVLDGHTKNRHLMIAVLSSPHGYKAQIVDSYPLTSPREHKDYDENRKVHTGFNSYMEFNPKLKEEDKSYAFTRVYTQVVDAHGEPLNDGGLRLYYFRKGKFQSECPDEAC